MCGIIGIYKPEKNSVLDIYNGLLMLQHRGQDAAGIVTYDGKKFHEQRGSGLVRDVFNNQNVAKLQGNFGMGHVRYPTAGTSDVSEAQPFFVNSPFGIYMIHNGNLTNTAEHSLEIREKYHRYLRTESDTEMLLNTFADYIHHEIKNGHTDSLDIIFNSVTELMKTVKGAYSVISLIHGVGMLVFRDPFGIRPLSYGSKKTSTGDEYIFASEDAAFYPNDYQKIRDVKPGEALLITLDGQVHTKQCVEGNLSPCIFEYIYLARPDSMIDDISVYKFQLRLGDALAKQVKASGLEIDSIIPVPDSSRPVALELSKATGIKYREGLVKNRYVGRTFIMPDQKERQKSVKQKLNIIPLEFRNRNVLLVDDSIVRGTTMRQIVKMCRDAGAKNVYVASAAPAVKHPNVYGVDMPTRKELVAHGLTTEEVAQSLGIDHLFYQTLEDTIAAAKVGNPNIEQFDCSCFDGKYITGDVDEAYLERLEKSARVQKRDMPLVNI
ncbi:amidophosphoribosyltransferase [bacterium DOLZORAL124_38_8]|nr:MAG: amidophosphoribosyltransferase [bacterium DOLZORAL124_38_8]